MSDGHSPDLTAPSCKMALMVALRSRRLESVFGVGLDNLRAQHIEGLVVSGVQEDFDLDYKVTLYGRGDSDLRALGGDVAALANTAGGVIILGVDEDDQARATATPGVDISDAEVARMRQSIASRVAPIPLFDIIIVPIGTTPVTTVGTAVSAQAAPANAPAPAPPVQRGFIVIAVPRSPGAPHAVVVNDALRYPKRNGTTTRYLSEAEVAAAYRDRLAAGRRQVARVHEIEHEAISRLSPSEMPWVVVSLVPDLPGDMLISGETFKAFAAEVTGRRTTILAGGVGIRRPSVGRRRFLADGTMDRSPLARWISLELHTDGSGVCAIAVENLANGQSRPPDDSGIQDQTIDIQGIVIAVISGLLQLAEHARDRAAAGGNALVRAQLYPVSELRSTRLGQRGQMGFVDQIGSRDLTEQPPAAETVAALDDLIAGPELMAVTARLVDEIGQAFDIPETAQLNQNGQLRRRYWNDAQVIGWAEQHGIEITNETI